MYGFEILNQKPTKLVEYYYLLNLKQADVKLHEQDNTENIEKTKKLPLEKAYCSALNNKMYNNFIQDKIEAAFAKFRRKKNRLKRYNDQQTQKLEK